MRITRRLLSVLLLASLPSAGDAAVRHRLNLPGGRLLDALITLGKQSGTSIGVSDPALANRDVPPLSGSFTVEEALRRLLRSGDARAEKIDPETFRVVRAVRIARPKTALRIPRASPEPRPVARQSSPASSDLQVPQTSPEIIVTASRRSWPLRSYPGSATIVDGADPALSGVRGTEAVVSRLPTLGSTHLGPGRNKLSVRGISESGFNGPTQATVGQYLGEARVNYSAPDPDLRLHDIDRVELLAGPQGTLYGAGSLGGIIRVVPNSPDLERIAVIGSIAATSVSHGDPGGDASVVLNMPLRKGRVGLRLSAYAVSEGGYIDDTQRDLDDINRVGIAGGRAALRNRPDDHWTVDLAITGQRIRGQDAQFADRGAKRLTRRSNVGQGFENNYLLGNLVAAREWEDLRFVGSASLVHQKLFERFDTTRVAGFPAAYDLSSRGSLMSAEARLTRGRPGASGWIAGATILNSSVEQDRDVNSSGATDLRNRIVNEVSEGALYGEGTISFANGVYATLGGRVSTSRLQSSGFNQRFGFPLVQRQREAARRDTRVLPSAALSAQPRADLLLYVRRQQSYRTGGLAIAGDDFNRFRPDKMTSYEAGMRYGVPGVGPVDVSAVFAYTSWSDIQADTIDNFAEITTANLGNAEIFSLDFSLGWRPLRELTLDASAAFNNGKITKLDPGVASTSPPQLPGVARFNGRLATHYSFAVRHTEVRLSAAARYTGKSKLGVEDLIRRSQGNWLDVSLLAEVNSGRHALKLGVTNLLDTAANRFALGSPLLIYQNEYVTPVRPRTIRVGWEVRFN